MLTMRVYTVLHVRFYSLFELTMVIFTKIRTTFIPGFLTGVSLKSPFTNGSCGLGVFSFSLFVAISSSSFVS